MTAARATVLDLFGYPEPMVEFESRPPAEESHAAADLGSLLAAGKTFGTIVADPPWSYATWSAKGQGRAPPYACMTFDEIAALPVQKLAAKDCRLFVWATWPHLPHAIGVMRAWGFNYSTAPFLWIKANKCALEGAIQDITDPSLWWSSKGKWTRTNSEVVLCGKRGKLARFVEDVPQVVVAPRLEHSRKPDEVADRIERLVAGPYLELFARRRRRGWTVFGNQIDLFQTGGR